MGRLFMPRRPPEVITASTGPCGGCCPHAAAPLITGGGRTPKKLEGNRQVTQFSQLVGAEETQAYPVRKGHTVWQSPH